MVYQGLPAGVKVLVKAMSRGRKVRRDRFVGSTGHWNSDPGSLSWELCSKAGAGRGGAGQSRRKREKFCWHPAWFTGRCDL